MKRTIKLIGGSWLPVPSRKRPQPFCRCGYLRSQCKCEKKARQ